MKHFIEIHKLQELYEKQFLEKSKQTDLEIAATSIRDLVEDGDLGILRKAGWIKANDINEIMEDHLILWIKQKCLWQ